LRDGRGSELPCLKDAVPPRVEGETVRLLPGAVEVMLLFLATVVMTACFHSYAHLPPVLGMMTGLGLLKVYGWWKSRKLCREGGSHRRSVGSSGDKVEMSSMSLEVGSAVGGGGGSGRDGFDDVDGGSQGSGEGRPLDIFKRLEQTEWDTLIFFYGVIMCVGGLGVLGYLDSLSNFAYTKLGPDIANILLGRDHAPVDCVREYNDELCTGHTRH